METLTIKELAPYLPYKLMIMDSVIGKPKVMNLGQGGSTNWIGIKTVLSYFKSGKDIYKPLLRPLSDLTRDEYWKLSGKDPKDSFGFWYGENTKYGFLHFEGYTSTQYSLDIINKIPYYAFEFLVKNHFDVFALIKKGLAYDLNTIKETVK